MKLAKSLLLGSAAALATVAGAQAADLPVRKAEPVAVEYVRVCSTYGSGFFVIPGTESCIRIAGRVRAEVLAQDDFNRGQDNFGFRARGRLSADVRTPTPYGLLRTFVRLQITANSGSPYNGGAPQGGGPNQSAILDQGFIQFGGLTAGRAPSFFSNTDLPTGHFGTLRFDDAPDITLFGYTYAVGNGFSISVSAEDPFPRRTLGNPFGFSSTTGRGAAFANGRTPFGIVQGGQEFPDFVGNLKYAGTWGSAQISGAVHQITDVGLADRAAVAPTIVPVFGLTLDPITGLPVQIGNVTTNPGSAAVPGRRAADDEIGFAVSGSLSVNLPMIAAGDAAWIWAGYADGNLQYLSGGNAFGTQGSQLGFDGNFSVQTPISNGFVRSGRNGGGGDIETTEGFSVAGGFRHYFIPATLRTNIFGSYFNVDYGNGASGRPLVTTVNGRNVRGSQVGFIDFEEFRVGGNLIWSPVSGLDIGVEVLYKNIQYDGRVQVTTPAVGSFGARTRLSNEEDTLEGRVRVQRDF